MFRIFAIGLGTVLVAVGITWFFTSLLDGPLQLMAGPLAANSITPLSKMALGDNFSWLFAGLSITGAGLLVAGHFSTISDCGKVEAVTPKAD